MAVVKGYDRSKWQGETTDEQVQYALDNGLFVILKASQGVAHADPEFHSSAKKYAAAGVPWTAYHFVTKDDGARQAANFMSQIEDYELWFPPFLDCEGYISMTGEIFSARDLDSQPLARKRFIDLAALDRTKYGFVLEDKQQLDSMAFALWKTYALSYPDEATVWSLSRSIYNVTGTEPGVYTNPSSGNTIFRGGYPGIGRMLLWVAHWNSPNKLPLVRPTLPNAWVAVGRWYIWQRGVIDGSPYKIPGKLDYNEWGNHIEYPYPVKPPEPGKTARVSIHVDGEPAPWVGDLKQEV